MAAGRGDGRGLHAPRPAAGDEHALAAAGGLHRAVIELAPRLGMLDAGDGIAQMEMPDAGLVAGDAGADVVELAGLGLGRHLGIADHRPGHAAEIGLARGQHLLGDLGLVDAAGDEDRLVHDLAHRGGEGRHIAVPIAMGGTICMAPAMLAELPAITL